MITPSTIQSAIHRAWDRLRVRMSKREELEINAVLLGPEEHSVYETCVREQIEAGFVRAIDIDDAYHGRPIRSEFAGKEVLASATPGIRFARVIESPLNTPKDAKIPEKQWEGDGL